MSASAPEGMRSSAVSSAGLLSLDRHLTTQVMRLADDFSENGSGISGVPGHGKSFQRVGSMGSSKTEPFINRRWMVRRAERKDVRPTSVNDVRRAILAAGALVFSLVAFLVVSW